MKEREVTGLIELKAEYENRLAQIKEYQELHQEFKNNAMALIKEAIIRKGIKVEERGSLPSIRPDGTKDCGFCTNCVTACTDCVAYS